MDLCEFEGRIYGMYRSQLFVLETDWDSFRPIQGVAWNGRAFSILEHPATRDIFSPQFGFGTETTRKTCDQLLRQTELETRRLIKNPEEFWAWCGVLHTSTWWRDRRVFLTPSCSEARDWKSYLAHLGARPKTLRRERPAARRITKRLLPK